MIFISNKFGWNGIEKTKGQGERRVRFVKVGRAIRPWYERERG